MTSSTASTADLEDDKHYLLMLRQSIVSSASLREMAERCVEVEEVMGGRPPTRKGPKEPRRPRGDI